MDNCSKMSASTVAALPADLLLEIFSHVPAKSVCRFKCVSKAWHDLIAEAWHDLVAGPDHGKKLRQEMQGLFIMNPGSTGLDFFSFVDVTAGSMPLDVDPHFSFLSPGMRNLVLSDSCNGLILFGHHELPYYDGLSDIVCNPTTKQWVLVPTCACPDDRSSYTFLAFDPAVSSHFHLVQFQISEGGSHLEALHAYSSETGTWSPNQIESQVEQGLVTGWHRHVRPLFYYEDSSHAFVNGFLYWVVQEMDQHRIVVVDVQGKARRMITMPSVPNWGRRLTCYIEQSQGCLHCITQEILYASGDNYKLSIWVLQGYDTQQEWVLKITVRSLEVFGGLTTDIFDIFNMRVVDIHQDRNLVFLFQCGSGKLIACNLDHKEVSVVATVKDWRPVLVFARYVPCFLESPALTS